MAAKVNYRAAKKKDERIHFVMNRNITLSLFNPPCVAVAAFSDADFVGNISSFINSTKSN
jgi:hypothetical protein